VKLTAKFGQNQKMLWKVATCDAYAGLFSPVQKMQMLTETAVEVSAGGRELQFPLYYWLLSKKASKVTGYLSGIQPI
jgi:hypothetical protein